MTPAPETPIGPVLARVLESAALLQRVVPDAVLVGGAAAAMHARHRESFDHDHVLADLADRYAEVLDAVEATDGWATSVRASHAMSARASSSIWPPMVTAAVVSNSVIATLLSRGRIAGSQPACA